MGQPWSCSAASHHWIAGWCPGGGRCPVKLREGLCGLQGLGESRKSASGLTFWGCRPASSQPRAEKPSACSSRSTESVSGGTSIALSFGPPGVARGACSWVPVCSPALRGPRGWLQACGAVTRRPTRAQQRRERGPADQGWPPQFSVPGRVTGAHDGRDSGLAGRAARQVGEKAAGAIRVGQCREEETANGLSLGACRCRKLPSDRSSPACGIPPASPGPQQPASLPALHHTTMQSVALASSSGVRSLRADARAFAGGLLANWRPALVLTRG